MDEKANMASATRKTYEAPAVKKVQLVVRHAVLSACHTSPLNFTPRDIPTPGAGCAMPGNNCYTRT